MESIRRGDVARKSLYRSDFEGLHGQSRCIAISVSEGLSENLRTPNRRLAVKGALRHDGRKNTAIVIEVPMTQPYFGLQSSRTHESVATDRLDEPVSLGRAPWEPRYSVVHGEFGMTFHFDLPDVVNPDIHIDCAAGRLQVWGNRHSKTHPHFPDEFSNRWYGPFAIELPLPQGIDVARMERQLDLGVLSLHFPFDETPLRRTTVPS